MKTKNLLLAVCFTANCLLPACSFSQGVWPWAKASQGTDSDGCLGMCTDAAGNVYITGRFLSPTISFGSVTLTKSAGGNVDFFIAKYDASGNALWARGAGGPGTGVGGYNVATDASGNVYAAGDYVGGTVTFGTSTLPYVNGSEIFLVKYDASGNILWATGAAGSGVEDKVFRGVATDPSGNVYLTGTFDSPTLTFGSYTLTNVNAGPGGHDMFLAKYDASGNVLWAIREGGVASDGSANITTDGSGNVYIVGSFSSPTLTFGSTTLTVGAGGFNNAFLVKYDGNGNVLWAKQSVQNWKCSGHAVAVNPSGTAVYIIGNHHLSPVSFGSFTLPQQGFWDGYFVKYDASSGNELCALNIGEPGGSSNVNGWGLAVDASGDVFIASDASVNNSVLIGSYTLPIPGGLTPCFVAVIDNNCNVICADALSEGGELAFISVVADVLGNVYVGGTFWNTFNVGATTLVQTPQWEDAWVAKYVKCTSSTLNVSATSTNILCNGQCTGTGTASPSGGTSPFTYSWNTSPVQNTQTATGLCAGNYNVTVTDAVGSTGTAPVTITQPAAITTSTTVTPVNCGSNNGSATVTASGGTPGYTYSWNTSPVQTTQTATGLGAGTYTATITDVNGCTKTQTITITNSNGPNATMSQTNILCNGQCTGSAIATVTGGTLPYTYLWTSGQTTSSASNLCTGSYTLTVTDAGGCTTPQTVTITQPATALSTTTTSTAASCGNNIGSATVNVSGGTGSFTYAWNPSGQTTSTATGLSAGNYTTTVTDANGCSTTQTVSVTSGSTLTLNTSSTATGCTVNNGTATANPSGGTAPYTYLWSNNSTTQQISNLSAGNYSVTVTDVNGCTQTAATNVTSTGGPSAVVTATAINLSLGGSSQLSATGGGTYSWSLASGLSCTNCQNPVASPNQTTTYCVFVTDANNCTDSACIKITVDVPCGNLFIPNAFSPNSDYENDIFYVRGNCITELTLIIYNRWGEKVFETANPTEGWDGYYKGKMEDTAVFAYYMKATLITGEEIIKKGNISLLR
ncbi:MAG: T9SS type B sorting domain-containing protein [Bacteroidetes bacterium]|nr:MAG: T9SS type B sorting domain-containing protein [Bacteroidota bacterium]